MTDIHRQRVSIDDKVKGPDSFLFLIQNSHFRHLKEYLKEKTFAHVYLILPVYSSATAIFQTAPLPFEFVEEVIRPWVEKWHYQYRENRLEDAPQIVCAPTVMTISIPLTRVERESTQLRM